MLEDIQEEPIALQNELQNNQVTDKDVCVLCFCKMDDKDKKLAQKLQQYLKERGELKKMVYRLKLKLQQSSNDQNGNLEIDMSNYDEGRAKAMRIFSVAQNQLTSDSNTINLSGQQLSKSVGPYKNRTAHMTSNEMNQIGLMQGTFYDYENFSNEGLIDQQKNQSMQLRQNHAASNPLIAKQLKNSSQNQQLLISLSKQNPWNFEFQNYSTANITTAAQNLSFNSLPTPHQTSLKNYMTTYGRQWQQDFTEKLEPKILNLSSQDRQQKILRKLEKERAKYMTGNKLYQENQKLLQEHLQRQRQLRLRRNTTQESINSQKLNLKNIMGGDIEQENGSGEIELKNQSQSFSRFDSKAQQKQEILSKSSNSQMIVSPAQSNNIKLNKSFTSSNKEHYNNQKLSSLGAFANASFNGGVFVHPPVDQI
eukprot:403340255